MLPVMVRLSVISLGRLFPLRRTPITGSSVPIGWISRFNSQKWFTTTGAQEIVVEIDPEILILHPAVVT